MYLNTYYSKRIFENTMSKRHSYTYLLVLEMKFIMQNSYFSNTKDIGE